MDKVENQSHVDLVFEYQQKVHWVSVSRLNGYSTLIEIVIPERPNIKVLHFDNAPCQTAISIKNFMASKNNHMTSQSPYSSDLAFMTFSSSWNETYQGMSF